MIINKPEVKSARTFQEKNQKMTREELQKQIKRMRDRDSEKIVGMFRNLENRATGGSCGSVVFSYKAYPGDENVFYELKDGERYSLPRGVARHLNNNCFHREYQHLSGQYGEQGMRNAAPDGRLTTAQMQVSRKIHRFAFDSMEFSDDDADMKPANLLEVTVTP